MTRPQRDGSTDIEELRARWRARADALGWAVPELRPARSVVWAEPVIPSSADRWTRPDVMVAIADRCRSGATLEELETACQKVMEDRRVLPVGPGGWHAVPRYTTVAAAERRARLEPSLRVDGRPEAVDRLRRSRQGDLLLVTPDPASAAALAARTGATTASVDTAVTASLGPRDLVVLMRAERMESLALERALRGCRAAVALGIPGPITVDPVAVGSSRAGPANGIEVVGGGANVGGSATAGGSATVSGSATMAGDARTAADLAVSSWVEARRQGRPALLVALPDEVEIMNARARAALAATGLRSSREVAGWAAGDLARFGAARPTQGIARHTLAEVVAVDGARIVLTVDGVPLTMTVERMQTVRPACAVPPLPGLLGGQRELFVIGGWLPPGSRNRGPVHRYITAPSREIGRDRAATRGLEVARQP